MDTYRGGRIHRIKLKNFLIYDSVEIYPAVGLNLIIGPNGSGKSSLLNAICLGLGGKPEFTGRSINLRSFVKHGHKTANIEIDLDDHENRKLTTVCREIKSNGESSFMINCKNVHEAQVENEISRFNIQFNNLCQFLPQEKVSKFATLNPKQLLECMQQAVGDQKLFSNYTSLIDLSSNVREVESELMAKKKYVEEETQKNARFWPEVLAYEEKKVLIDKLHLLTELQLFSQYNKTRPNLSNLRKKDSELTECIEEQCKLIEHLSNDKNEVVKELTKYENEIKNLGSGIRTLHCELQALYNHRSKCDKEIYDIKITLSDFLEDEVDQNKRRKALEQEIISLKKKRQKFQQELRKQPDISSMMQDLRKIKEQRNNYFMPLCNMGSVLESLHKEKEAIEAKIRSLKDTNSMKLSVLEKKDRHTYEALKWLRSNKSKFKKVVLGPILTLINVHNEQDAKFIECHIPYRDMFLFLCEDDDDMKLFLREVRDKQNLSVNVAKIPENPSSSFIPRISLSELQRTYNFKCYLKDLIIAPDAVLSYLCSVLHVHQTPVGDSAAENYFLQHDTTNIDFPFFRCYTPTRSYTFISSRYRKKKSVQVQKIFGNGLLNVPLGDISVLEQQKEEIEKKITDVQQDHNKCYQEDNELSKQQEQLNELIKWCQEKKDEIDSLSRHITQKEILFANTVAKPVDLMKEKQNCAIKINQLCIKKLEIFETVNNILKEQLRLVKKEIKVQCHRHYSLKRKQHKEQTFQEANNKLCELKKTSSCYKAEFEKLQTKLERMLKKFESMCQIDLTNQQTKNILLERYKNLPKNYKTIENEISTAKAKIQCSENTSEETVEEYRKREQDISIVRQETEKLQGKLNKMKKEIQKKKQKWLDPLENLVSKISLTFGKYFESLGYAGEVSLSPGEHVDDFDNYGLSIKVKYRNTDSLNELSQVRHSGGECSVATMLFMLSLQELTEVPFRCVDEINQGMDYINERQVFDLLTKSAEKSSQYFLLTPKLLSGLRYSPKMKILMIYNGALLHHLSWNFSTLCTQIKRAKEKEANLSKKKRTS